jgi:hypothetical protein
MKGHGKVVIKSLESRIMLEGAEGRAGEVGRLKDQVNSEL